MELEVSGRSVVRAYRNAFAVQVKLDGDEEIGFTLEERYIVRCSNHIYLMHPADDDEDRIQSCFESLYGVPVEKAIARETGELRLEFVDGSSLDCGPGGMYEPWAYCGPRRARVWSLTGGRLMIVDPE